MIKEIPLLPLRDYQAKAWDYLMSHNTRRSFFIWHRRAGKDLFGLQYLVARAMMEVGNYWYILPQQNQVRRAIWEGITSKGIRYLDLIPEEWVYKKSEQEMKITLKDPRNQSQPGSIISFLGGDRYDSLVGAGIKGCVISEYALQRPNLYDLAIQPMLMESKGWVMFNTTPRGQNHAYDMYRALKDDPDAYTSLLTIEDTGIMDKADLEVERKRGKPEEIIQQEFYCSWQGAIHGAYYADVLSKAEVGDFPYDPRYPVHTTWDLGVSDSMAIWFVQFINGTIRLIDYYEASTYGLGHYADVVLSKGYRYAGHHLPHDGVQRQLTVAEKAQSIQGQLLTLGLNNVDIIPRTHDVYADIQAVRAILPLCRFSEKCKMGYDALMNYRREYDEDRKCFKNNPLHDWSSHSCLTGNSLVLTKDGYKKIKDVRVGDYVKYDDKHFGYVANSGKVKESETMVITLKSGEKIECTPDHKLFTIRGVVRADELCYNDTIATKENKLWIHLLETTKKLREDVISCTKALNTGCGRIEGYSFLKLVESKQSFKKFCSGMGIKSTRLILLTGITRILMNLIGKLGNVETTLGQKENTGCLTTKGSTRKKMGIGGAKYMGQCTNTLGNTIMGKFQTATRFITKIGTKITTRLKTCVSSLLLNILNYTLKTISGLVVKKTNLNLERLWNLQRSGTQAKKGTNGTKNKVSMAGKTEKKSKRTVLCVGKNLEHTIQTGENSALQFASNVICIERKKKKKPVYDLTILGHHCFYANGILVSNCDAFRIVPIIERTKINTNVSYEPKTWGGMKW